MHGVSTSREIPHKLRKLGLNQNTISESYVIEQNDNAMRLPPLRLLFLIMLLTPVIILMIS